MNTASINEIKKELKALNSEALADLCLRLAKYKVENKELLNYLLFEAHNESSYIAMIKEVVDDFFSELPDRNTYLIKKTLRKILRFVNRQIKYSGLKETEIELRIYFCMKVKQAHVPLVTGTVLYNLYQQQLNKINMALTKLPDDLQADYQREINNLV